MKLTVCSLACCIANGPVSDVAIKASVLGGISVGVGCGVGRTVAVASLVGSAVVIDAAVISGTFGSAVSGASVGCSGVDVAVGGTGAGVGGTEVGVGGTRVGVGGTGAGVGRGGCVGDNATSPAVSVGAGPPSSALTGTASAAAVNNPMTVSSATSLDPR